MSKDLEVIKADVENLMLKNWTKTEVKKLNEFMEDVIIATMQVIKIPLHITIHQSEKLVCEHPKDQLEGYHDSSIICKKCNCIIEQFGRRIHDKK